MRLVSLETMIFRKESHEKGRTSKKYWKTCMRITCITKRCSGSLHIEWASCVAVTLLNLYVRAQEWIDHLYLPRLLILKIASRYFHNTRNLCLSGKLRQQVQRTVDNYRNFCLRRLYEYLYLSSLRLLFSISRAKSPVSKAVWVNLAF